MKQLRLHTPHGNPLTILVREDTADESLAAGLLGGDEYQLHDISHLSGIGLDVGAHIGLVSLAMLVDFPELRMVAVEPLQENIDVMREAADANGVTDRLTIMQAAAAEGDTVTIGYDYTDVEGEDPGYVHDNRYIGGIWRADKTVIGKGVEVPAVTLRSLWGDGPYTFIKTDCEGGEYALFSEGCSELRALIVGEWHDGDSSRLRALLEPTHDFEVIEDHGGTGIFWATPR